MQGKTYKLQFTSADATTAAAVSLFDDNDAVYTLKSTDRLLIDTLVGNLAAAVLKCDIFSDDDAGGSVGTGERIACFGPGPNVFVAGAEGYAVPVGVTPKVKATVAGQVDITGSVRVVHGTGPLGRPSWREKCFGQV